MRDVGTRTPLRASSLRLVDDDYQTDHEQHSIRAVDLTAEHLADLEFLARNVLTSGDLAIAELRNAIGNRNRDQAIAASRRLLAVGLLAGDRARQMERET